MMGMDSMDMSELETAKPFDRAFIDMMVPHHQAAIEEAKIAQQRAQHDELKSMADDIISSQQAEIDKMKEWRADWFGSADTPPISAMPMLPGMSTMPGMETTGDVEIVDMTQKIEALRNAPEPFDLAFIDAMIPHHSTAIEAAQMALEQAERQELKDMAQMIIDDQEKERAQLQTWREEWYADAAAASP